MENKIRVAIVEDDPVWIESLTFLLNNEKDIEVVTQATNKDDAVKLAKSTEVDVFLMDINLNENEADGIYAAAEIYQLKQSKIIMLTSLEDEEVVKNSFIAGAVNFLSKDNYSDVPSLVRSVHNRHSPFEVVLKDYHRLKEQEQLYALTPAEREILELIQEGYSQTMISGMLYKTLGTLKSQVNKILKKLGVSNTKEAIKKIKTGGLLK